MSVVGSKVDLPLNTEDFNQPDWVKIIEAAFPPWSVNANATCPRMDKVGGTLMKGYETFPEPQTNKFNPCYYTKAFAGADPMLGGYPTPIDTKYPYEFAAPFFKQPGDGSTHHCPIDSSPDTKIQTCPKIAPKCDGDKNDCNKVTHEFGVGHVPPFVPLAAIKNAYNDLLDKDEVCDWFSNRIQPCSIPVAKLDDLVYEYFVTDGEVQFTPPKILDNLNPSDPKSTYYKLEYLDDEVACADNNCRGPHYCSKAVAEDDIWGDFCPYIHTGENSGLYRHPHVALAAVELWFASKCKPDSCPSTWLDSPNGANYGDKYNSTSITWAEMDDNKNQIAQPMCPYKWPNSGDGIFPGHELYDKDAIVKPVAGSYVTRFVTLPSGTARVSVIGIASITMAVTTALSLI